MPELQWERKEGLSKTATAVVPLPVLLQVTAPHLAKEVLVPIAYPAFYREGIILVSSIRNPTLRYSSQSGLWRDSSIRKTLI